MRIQTAAAVAIALIPVMAAAQQFLPNLGPPVDPNTRFEVAAIKPVGDASGQVLMRMSQGRFESIVPVGVLLRQALQKSDYEMAGIPGWTNTERYSITAKVPEGVPPAATSVMLVNLLKDRFQLVTHLETREQTVSHLVMARPDGRFGPSLKVTSADCQATIAARMAAAQAAAAGRGGPPVPPPFPDPKEPVPCGYFRVPPGLADARGFAMAQLARTLSDFVGRPVIDKTGLAGLYDFTLKYSPELGRVAGPFALLVPPSPGAPPTAADPDAPSLLVALQEQLGLKLENVRGPVEVVVIDKLEKPTLD